MTDQLISASVAVASTWQATFCTYLEQRGSNTRTISAYQSDLSQYAAWFEQVNGMRFSPDLLTGVDLRAYREHCLVAKVAPTTFNRRRTTLGILCGWAQHEGLLAYDPMQGVDVIPEVELAPRGLSHAETHRLMRQVEVQVNAARTPAAVIQSARDQAMVCLMLYAGLREAEVCNLDMDDLLLSERRGKVVVRRGKGDKKREVPLGREVRRALEYWLTLRPQGGQALFPSQRSGRLSTRQVQRTVEDISRLASVSCTPHTLRHTFAHRFNQDNGLVATQRILGHARLETTARYTLPTWQDLENAVENL